MYVRVRGDEMEAQALRDRYRWEEGASTADMRTQRGGPKMSPLPTLPWCRAWVTRPPPRKQVDGGRA